ncbi:hypothetical protein [Microvirga flavescens]|uniref:hypothetical protein n=1 Tax=Microvirga flavescens TaxID=2249811 RepID=UPI000DD88C33|nr:hypothetical protein [Microvirga flavescens]
MSNGRTGQNADSASGRAINLEGDSPELVAFALLRNLAQIEQGTGVVFDRAWLLNAYADCLKVVKGEKVEVSSPAKADKARATKR